MSYGYEIPMPPVLSETYNFVLILFLPTSIIKGQGITRPHRRWTDSGSAGEGSWVWAPTVERVHPGGQGLHHLFRQYTFSNSIAWIPFLVRGQELLSLWLPSHVFCERVSAPSAGLMLAQFQERTATWKVWSLGGWVGRMCALSTFPQRATLLSTRPPSITSNISDSALVPLDVRDFRFWCLFSFPSNLQVSFPPLPSWVAESWRANRILNFSCGFHTPEIAKNLSYYFRNH